MFSVVIPLYNKELSIRNTLQSVLDQTFTDFEIVIVNDGSTDSSVAIVEEFINPRIRLIHQENQGVSAARNRGITEATYEWVAFLDADDLWLEDHLSTLADMIDQYSEEKVFATSYIKSNDYLPTSQSYQIEIVSNYFKKAIEGYFIWTGVMCIHKLVFVEIGNFNVRLSRGEDLEMWMRIGKTYKIIQHKRTTAIYRNDAENRAVESKMKFHSSIISAIDIKNSSTKIEEQYKRKLIIERLKILIITKQFFTAFKLLYKHNMDLIR